ncbi:MAG TPA: hypothetical protein PKK15_02150 [Kouleothrix sp.]|uniref:hypothetical protein n=1 Tax=Kouleothrix sp. TaxID=2779161 RepID=UPI002C077CD5|nr:hypothetical protein [Kouleothrix sp.]
MILVRIIFQVRQGHIRQAVDGMKQATAHAPNRPRILTDLSGPMNTMVMETRFESLAAAEQWRNALFASQEFKDNADVGNDWIVGGANEFYTIEQE